MRRGLTFHPLTRERWSDFEQLFGERGACGGCWCMWWRLSRREFDSQKGEGNRAAMRRIVESGEIPGIIAYFDGKPIGWCSVAPRECFPVLLRSRSLRPVDDEPVWSVVCFYIDRGHRGRGVSAALLRAAMDHVEENGGSVVEGYPIDTDRDDYPTVFAQTGFRSTFANAGFKEVERRSKTRPIMRYRIK